MSLIEPWGKISRFPDRDLGIQRLSLVAHCVDVASVTQALLELPTWRRRLETCADRNLSAVDLARLSALAFLHDIGKACAGFYSKGEADDVVAAWRRTARVGLSRMATGHVKVVLPLFEYGSGQLRAWTEALGRDDILAWGGEDEEGMDEVEALWMAAISHHGEPLTRADMDDRQQLALAVASWRTPIAGYEPLAGLRRMGDAARALFPQAFEAAAPALRARPELIHGFAGLVSLADWIASNAEPGFFPYDLGDCQDERRWTAALPRARAVLREMRIDLEACRADLQRREPTFECTFGGRSARPAQSAMSHRDLGPLVTIEAETGSGKTEAALWRFKTLFEAGEVDALCFLLPTRVAATALAQRVQQFVDTLFPDPALQPNTVLAVPGYLRANGLEGRKGLAPFEVLWPDDKDPGRRPLYWAAEHSKRYFAAACATATIDQFLLSTLQTKHAHLRGTALLRALVVVDEVHASDAYMTALLCQSLHRHVRAGGHGLLMSATLTGDARRRLVLAGQDLLRTSPSTSRLSDPEAPYPSVTDIHGIRSCQAAGDPGKGSSAVKRIRREVQPWARDADAVAARVAAAVDSGARVLVIRNTVGLAIETQQAIEARLGAGHPALFRPLGMRSDAVAMHHGRYAFEDRQLLDRAVERDFGTGAAADQHPRVLVGTQTLEISLDCDADLMITDIAPIDVLLQRFGRLHRHADRHAHRAQGYQQALAIILAPGDMSMARLLKPGGGRGLGLGARSAYENVLALEAALRLALDPALPEWRIPEHNRRLVEAGAGPSALSQLAAQLGEAWSRSWREYVGLESAKAGQAWPVSVSWDKEWEFAGWSDLGEAVRTRLGLNNVDIELPDQAQPWLSPFGQALKRLSIPHWLLPQLDGEPPQADCQSSSGGSELHLRVGDRHLVYDRLGLRSVLKD